jgi:riboflavin synthase
MFTGLVEAVGQVADVVAAGSGFRIRVSAPLSGELHVGESLAVNGVCLTVIAAEGRTVDADIGPETARVTTLGQLKAGSPVNLERSMPADGRFGGHFVQGHVDGVGRVEQIREDGDAHWLTVSFGEPLAPYLIEKGSIAVDGVSLTIAGLHDGTLDVMLVPHTWDHTTLRTLRAGDRVNLECDMIGKYVARSVERTLPRAR